MFNKSNVNNIDFDSIKKEISIFLNDNSMDLDFYNQDKCVENDENRDNIFYQKSIKYIDGILDKYMIDNYFDILDINEEDKELNNCFDNFQTYDNSDLNDSNDEDEEIINDFSFEKKYSYDVSSFLDSNLNLDNIDINNTFVYICAYNVNIEAMKPFLYFLLIKDIFTGLLSLPSIILKNKNNIVNEVELFLNIILLQKDILKNKFIINGYKIFQQDIYVFIEINEKQAQIDNNETFLALVHEIMNTKHICNMKISSKVYNFFSENPEFLFLKDENDKKFEIPVVTYQSVEEKKMKFTFMFGISKSESPSMMGTYFYFTDYKNAIDKFTGKNIKYGIIRCALFLGSMKIPMNFIDDDIDNSDIKKILLKTSPLSDYEMLTMRITDYDANWSKLYDSVYLGRTELDNGTFLNNTPLWVVKEYCQQFPLSYKIIGKKITIL